MTWPRLYLVSPVTIKAGTLTDLVPELAHAGVDIIQLREKEMEAGDLLRAGAPLLSACRQARVPLVVNDRPDVALALGADGVHLGQNDLSVGLARRILGESVIVGRSTHAEREIDSELASPEKIDYLSVGPIEQTPTKPGRPGTGLGLVEYAARTASIPWFVTGGVNPESLPRMLEAGARRAVVVRAIVEASDPIAVAARLRELLDSVPVEH
ncbi:MAG: thiamine phosphate synthase [Actinomycetota bacterium]|nr:thiamine phosphate synthase [Actinomycetota bacterium]